MAPASGVPALASSSLSSLSSSHPESSPASSSYSHISRASAAKAIQHLDRFAFPTLAFAAEDAAAKRRKVAEVTDTPLRSKRSSNFTTLAGIGHLHRERARRRRSERLAGAGAVAIEGRAADRNATQSDGEALAKTFQPFSRPLLLARLSSYSVSSYSHKPDFCKNLEAVTLAMQGWMHESGKERDVITCATCRAEWKVQVAVTGLASREEQDAAWNEVDGSVLSKHQHWCPWKLRQCHASLFRVPVHTKVETLSEIVQGANILSQCKDIDQVQITSLVEGAELDTLQQLSSTGDRLTIGCILLSLLGWKLTGPPGPVQGCIVQCDMCARKIGLWNFLQDRPGDRTLHVNKEHKSYCPFVNAQMQSGRRGLERGAELSSTASPGLNAFEQRMQILRGNSENVRHLFLNQQQIRQMKSSETLAKLKSIIM